MLDQRLAVTLTVAELAELIERSARKAVADALKEIADEKARAETEILLTSKEAKKKLGISGPTLTAWAKEHKIKPVKNPRGDGRATYWRASDLQKIKPF